jgi:hypothetical protein
MRFDGWIFMFASWLAILAMITFSIVKILRQKK